MEPGDVDCAVLVPSIRKVNRLLREELEAGLPFLQVLVVSRDDFEILTSETFATDRYGVAKGMIEIAL
jgi:hypothetical protein